MPKSVENDVAATALSFGFNSTLSFVAEMLERVRQAAQAARRIGVVEVPGGQAGWLALQAGIAGGADAVLIPEIPYDLRKVAAKLREKTESGPQIRARGGRRRRETLGRARDPVEDLGPGHEGRAISRGHGP